MVNFLYVVEYFRIFMTQNLFVQLEINEFDSLSLSSKPKTADKNIFKVINNNTRITSSLSS